MQVNIYLHRKPLARTFDRLAEGQLTVGFLGGSITAPAMYNWPEPVISWFSDTFPQARITVENAAIGSTGSEMAVFRAKQDILDRNCDLVFVEYAVNDIHEFSEERMRTREGLLRTLLGGGNADLVIVYTYTQDMYEEMMRCSMPSSIAEFEELAEQYGIGSIWMGMHALEEVKKGKLSWEEWLPDGLHPSARGSLCYAQSVIEFLQSEWRNKKSMNAACSNSRLPAPCCRENWDTVSILDVSQIDLTGPWTLRRRRHLASLDQALLCSAPGAGISFIFEGRGLTLASMFGQYAAEFRWRLDDGEWRESNRDRSGWCPDQGYPRMDLIADDLVNGRHRFELEIFHGNKPNCRGTNFELLFVGIIH